MRKITNTDLDVVDFVLEPGLIKLSKLIENLSDEAKIAYVPSFEEQQAANEKNFALVLWDPAEGKLHKYALYTPELTELNLAFLADLKNELPEEAVKIAATNLTVAAKNYKLPIPEALQEYTSDKYIYNVLDVRDINKVAFITKTAFKETEPTAFAWAKEKKYPLHNKINIKKAAAYFEKEHYKMPIAKKSEFCQNVIDAANTNNVPLDNTAIHKYASFDTIINPDFVDHIKVRISYLKDHESDKGFKDTYTELIKRASTQGQQEVEQIMRDVETADITSGLFNSYGKGIADPYETTLSVVKVAERTVDGMTVSLEQLRNIPDGELTGLVGNAGISELKAENGLDVFAALPRPVRKDILDLL